MGDGDECLDPVGDGFHEDIRNPVLGDDVHGVRPRRGHHGSGCEVQHDAGHERAVLVLAGCRQANERLAALRCERATDEVSLSAGGAVHAMADGLGCDLAREVDGECRVDGAQVVVTADGVDSGSRSGWASRG